MSIEQYNAQVKTWNSFELLVFLQISQVLCLDRIEHL